MSTQSDQFEILLSGIRNPANDTPAAGWFVKFFAAGTDTAKNAYEDNEKQSAVTKKELDANGQALVYGDGIYKVKIYSADPDAVPGLEPTIIRDDISVGYGGELFVSTLGIGSEGGKIVLEQPAAGSTTGDVAIDLYEDRIRIYEDAARSGTTTNNGFFLTVNGGAASAGTELFHRKNLFMGTVNADGTANTLPSGWASSKLSTGLYQVTYNGQGITSQNPQVVVSIAAGDGQGGTAGAGAANFTANTRDSAGNLADKKFTFCCTFP